MVDYLSPFTGFNGIPPRSRERGQRRMFMDYVIVAVIIIASLMLVGRDEHPRSTIIIVIVTVTSLPSLFATMHFKDSSKPNCRAEFSEKRNKNCERKQFHGGNCSLLGMLCRIMNQCFPKTQMFIFLTQSVKQQIFPLIQQISVECSTRMLNWFITTPSFIPLS